MIGRLVIALGLIAIALLFGATGSAGGQLGSLGVTLIYVFGGVAIQYLIGLGLAFLCAQKLAGRRFFRVVFFIPMMITPVGIAYTFRMLTDTTKGPFAPFWQWFGLGDFAWAATAWGARIAVMIGDAWQWIPFMFIVLLASLESQPQDQVEAAMVDGASRWQVFRYLTIPAILPVSVTLVLIRMIEAFKIVDLPNVLTNGGRHRLGILTLHAFMAWRALDLGGSAAVAYILLFIVTFCCLSFMSSARRGGRRRDDRAPTARPGRALPAGEGDRVPPLGVLDRRPVPALLARDHLVQAAARRQRGPILPAVHRLPAVARRLAYLFGTMLGDTLRPYRNTMIVALLSSAISLAVGTMAAYALVRLTYRPRVGAILGFVPA